MVIVVTLTIHTQSTIHIDLQRCNYILSYRLLSHIIHIIGQKFYIAIFCIAPSSPSLSAPSSAHHVQCSSRVIKSKRGVQDHPLRHVGLKQQRWAIWAVVNQGWQGSEIGDNLLTAATSAAQQRLRQQQQQFWKFSKTMVAELFPKRSTPKHIGKTFKVSAPAAWPQAFVKMFCFCFFEHPCSLFVRDFIPKCTLM